MKLRNGKLVLGLGALIAAGSWSPISTLLKKHNAQSHFVNSEELTKEGKWSEAEVELKQALKNDPDYFEARDALAVLMAEMERPLEAKATYDEGIRRTPNEVRLYYKAASVLFAAKEYAKADPYAQKALQLGKDTSEYYILRGMILERMNQYQKAYDLLDDGLKRLPEDLIIKRGRDRMKRKLSQQASPTSNAPISNDGNEN